MQAITRCRGATRHARCSTVAELPVKTSSPHQHDAIAVLLFVPHVGVVPIVAAGAALVSLATAPKATQGLSTLQ